MAVRSMPLYSASRPDYVARAVLCVTTCALIYWGLTAPSAPADAMPETIIVPAPAPALAAPTALPEAPQSPIAPIPAPIVAEPPIVVPEPVQPAEPPPAPVELQPIYQPAPPPPAPPPAAPPPPADEPIIIPAAPVELTAPTAPPEVAPPPPPAVTERPTEHQQPAAPVELTAPTAPPELAPAPPADMHGDKKADDRAERRRRSLARDKIDHAPEHGSK